MRKKLLLILVLTILVTSTLVGCSGAGASSIPSTLTILSITEGDVFVMKAGTDDWTEATVEMSLEVGDTIKTGDDSGAEITFFDGSTIELEAGTQIEITSLDSSPDTGTKTITLMQTIGTTISRVTKLLDPASSYTVETPSGVAAVRGSMMIVRIVSGDPNYEDGTVLITCVEGDILVICNGVELHVPEGYTCVIRPDGLPELIPPDEPPQEETGDVTDEDTSNGESEEQQPDGSTTDNLPEIRVRLPDLVTPPPDGETPAVIEVTTTVVSDTTSQVIWVGGSTDDLPRDASEAWEHSAWSGIDHSFTEATWIWESYRTQNPIAGDVVEFEKTFDIPGSPVSATLYITCDNGYDVYVNDTEHPAGQPAGDPGAMSAQLFSGWLESDLKQEYVDTNGWQTVESWDVTDFIQSGENTLTVYTANEQMDGGTQDSNPAGLIFELVVTYDTESTGSE